MKIDDLQMEINHLLFLYYTTIGVIQRDAMGTEIHENMDAMIREIIECKKRIDNFIESSTIPREYPPDYSQVLEAAKKYVEDGLAFIDFVVDN